MFHVEQREFDRPEGWEEGFAELLVWLQRAHPHVTKMQCGQLKKYCSYLYYGSSKINLITAGDRGVLATKHILPSVGLASFLSALPNANILDLGSGAGLPGIPLKVIFPNSYFYLVESRRKRANFLREVVRKLDLRGIEICNVRVETLHAGLTNKVDVVVSRATKNMDTLFKWVGPILKPHGVLIVTLDKERGMQKAKGIILRRKSEWSGGVSWYGGVR